MAQEPRIESALRTGRDLGGHGGGCLRSLLLLRSGVVGGTSVRAVAVVESVDGDLDGDGAATDLFALESLDGLLLLLLVADVDEAVALRLAGLPPATTNDASAVDLDVLVGEELGEALVINVEAEVGDEEDGLRRLAGRVLAGRARGTRGTRLALARLLLAIGTFNTLRTGDRRLALRGRASLALGLALIAYMNIACRHETLRTVLTAFFFFLGFSASPVAGASPSALVASPFASASLTSPGTDLLPRRPVLFLTRLCFFSWSFCSAGLATSTITVRPSSSCLSRSSTAFWAASRVVRDTKP